MLFPTETVFSNLRRIENSRRGEEYATSAKCADLSLSTAVMKMESRTNH